MELRILVNEILPIARKAGDKILEVYSDEASFGVESKSDNSPLTRADKLSNEVIMKGLEEISIQYPIISEENKEIEYEVRKSFDTFWLVDPLDGTKEFIKRNGEFTVNIALVEKGRVILGVVYVPVTDEMYWGARDIGAYYENDGNNVQLTANSFTMKDEGLRVVCSRSHINDETQRYIDKLTEPQIVSRGSSLKFIILARSEAEIYPRIGPTMEWDTAAAQIILEESGGQVLEFETRQPLQYNKKSLLNPYFVALAKLS